jgi:site-specific DNA recombinase
VHPRSPRPANEKTRNHNEAERNRPLCGLHPQVVRGGARAGIQFAARRSAKPARPALAQRERVSRSYFTRLVRLSYLAPDITQAILDGQQPRDLTADKLLEHSRLPLAWHDQRTVLGFA